MPLSGSPHKQSQLQKATCCSWGRPQHIPAQMQTSTHLRHDRTMCNCRNTSVADAKPSSALTSDHMQRCYSARNVEKETDMYLLVSTSAIRWGLADAALVFQSIVAGQYTIICTSTENADFRGAGSEEQNTATGRQHSTLDQNNRIC